MCRFKKRLLGAQKAFILLLITAAMTGNICYFAIRKKDFMNWSILRFIIIQPVLQLSTAYQLDEPCREKGKWAI